MATVAPSLPQPAKQLMEISWGGGGGGGARRPDAESSATQEEGQDPGGSSAPVFLSRLTFPNRFWTRILDLGPSKVIDKAPER